MVGRLVRLAVTAAILLGLATPAYAIPAAVIFGAAAAASAGAIIATIVINLVLSMLVSLVFQSLFKPKGPQAQAQVTTLQLGETPRQALFGRVATAGTLVDAFNTGGSDHTKWEVVIIAVADHKCHGLVGVYVNDQFCAITSDGAVPGIPLSSGLPILYLWWRDGSAGQTLPTALVPGSALPGSGNSGPALPAGFTNNDFTGTAYLVMAYRADDAGTTKPKWPGGRPHFLFVIDGKRCYDPRKDSTVTGGSGTHRWATPSTWEFSKNPIVCRYNWVRGIYALDEIAQPEMLLDGRGLTATEAPPENVAAYANICDETVTKADATTEPRYTCAAVINADEDYITVEEKFAACVAGIIVQPSGAVEVEPGASKAATASFTDDDLLVGLPVKFSNFRSESDNEWVNTIVPSYTEPTQQYQNHAAPVRRVYADVIADGKSREQTLTLDFVSSGTQAQRCGEIQRRLGRLIRSASVTLGPRFAGIEEGDNVVWTSARYTGGLPVEFRVGGYSLNEKWQNTLTLREINSAVYDWTTANEIAPTATTTPQAPPPDLVTPSSSDWTFTGVTLAGPNGSLPALLITGAVPAVDLHSISMVIFEYRLYVPGQADSAGWGGASQEPVTVVRKEIRGVAPGTDYDVSISYANHGYVSGRLILTRQTSGDVGAPTTSVNGPNSLTIEADATGVVIAGQLPLIVGTSVMYGVADVTTATATTYSIVTTGGIAATVDNTIGSATKGVITITDAPTPYGEIILTVVQNGITQPAKTIQVNRHDAIPTPPATTKTKSTTTFVVPFTRDVFTPAFTPAFTGIVVAAGEKLYCYGTLSAYHSVNSYDAGQRFHTQWQYAVAGSGAWVNFGGDEAGAPMHYYGGSITPASSTFNHTANPGAGTYDVRLMVYEHDPDTPGVTSSLFDVCYGTCSVEAKV